MAVNNTLNRAPAFSAKAVWDILRKTFEEWQKDNAPRLAAALTYYALFAMPPIFIITLAVAGVILGPQAARGELFAQTETYLGTSGAQVVQGLVANSATPNATLLATIISVIAIAIAASGLFAELQYSLNQMWDIPTPKQEGILSGALALIKGRLLAFSLVLGAGVLLLVTFILGIAISALGDALQGVWAEGTAVVLQVITFIATFLLMAAVIAILYRVLPDTHITWGDVWIGALFTSLLLNIGRLLIAIYLSTSSFNSTYGTAGSLIALLVWVNYSAQIFYLGAEFTQVYARRHGSHIGEIPAA